MDEYKKFTDLGIKEDVKAFQGDKISIDRVINTQVTILDYRIETSKYPDKRNGKRLDLSIKMPNGEQRIAWTGSINLQNTIQKVPTTDFPFTTTIVKLDKLLKFT